VTEHAVWTFQVIGGEPFTLTVPKNPPLEHRSGMTPARYIAWWLKTKEVK